jgi:hypothetical protein
MLSIILVGVFSTKVVPNEAEGDGKSIGLPVTSGEWYRMVLKEGD